MTPGGATQIGYSAGPNWGASLDCRMTSQHTQQYAVNPSGPPGARPGNPGHQAVGGPDRRQVEPPFVAIKGLVVEVGT